MTITTHEVTGIDRGVRIQGARDPNDVVETIRRVTEGAPTVRTPMDTGTQTIHVTLHSSRRARALVAYLRAYYALDGVSA